MKVPSRLRLTFYFLAFAGAALFTALLVREGVGQIGGAIATAGWAILAVVAYHFFVPVFLDSLAWWVLFPKAERPPLRRIYWMRWIGESVSTLVPSAAVGGDIVRARLAAVKGTPLPIAAGTVLVDLTLGVFTQAAFTLLGVLLLVQSTGRKNFVGPTLIGTLVGVAAVGGFYFVQRRGMFRFLARMIAKLANSPEWQSLVQTGETLDQTIRTLYARRRGVIGCCVSTIFSLILNSGEIWIALYALNLHATVVNAIILQSMALTIRSVAFPVPGGIGVQESGYVLVGNLLGIPGDTAFALSLIARVRELTLGIPGVIAWQLIEGRRLLRTRTAGAAS
ncbi:MAG TPA: flippase-like domain-containing protein [Chthoniobacterales bacterium]|jgi:putative membrane protein|nr:flippase-like domain-containing protein [Chthoniobacterales bacterium]